MGGRYAGQRLLRSDCGRSPTEGKLTVSGASLSLGTQDRLHRCLSHNSAALGAWVVTIWATNTARTAAKGRQAQHRCRVLGWPWRNTFLAGNRADSAATAMKPGTLTDQPAIALVHRPTPPVHGYGVEAMHHRRLGQRAAWKVTLPDHLRLQLSTVRPSRLLSCLPIFRGYDRYRYDRSVQTGFAG